MVALSRLARLVFVSTLPLLLLVPRTAQAAHTLQSCTATDLGTLPGGSNSYATGINNHGQIVGYSDTASGSPHAVEWQSGSITDLGTLGGGQSEAYGINGYGQIVGFAISEVGRQAVHAPPRFP